MHYRNRWWELTRDLRWVEVTHTPAIASYDAAAANMTPEVGGLRTANIRAATRATEPVGAEYLCGVTLVWKLIAFVLPLAVDSFAAAALLGAGGVTPTQRRRITAVFVVFEAGMPLIGLSLGAAVARAIGGAADYVAGPALIALGTWMLFFGDE
jgi:hypothetical protein